MCSINMADADFVSCLDEKTLAKAEKELFENPKERLSAVKTFREWITSQKHLTGPTGNMDTALLFNHLLMHFVLSHMKYK